VTNWKTTAKPIKQSKLTSTNSPKWWKVTKNRMQKEKWQLCNPKQISSVQFTSNANRYPESQTVPLYLYLFLSLFISLWSTLWHMLSHKNHPSTDPKTNPPLNLTHRIVNLSYFIQLNFYLYVCKWAKIKAKKIKNETSKHFLKRPQSRTL